MRTRTLASSPRLTAGLLLLAVLWLAATAFVPLADTIVYVGQNPLNLRSGPTLEFSVVAELQPGEQLKVLSESNGWYNVTRVSTGQTGWVDKTFTRTTPPPVDTTPYTVAVGKVPLNLRTSPSLDSKIVAQLTPGEMLIVKSRSGDWYNVTRPATGDTGYVVVSYTGPVYYDAVAAGTVVYVGKTPLSFRTGPGPKLSKIADLQPYEALTVLSQAGRWLQVTRQLNNTTGWVHGDYVTKSAPLGPTPAAILNQLAMVNTAFLNLRSGPGASFPVILKMPRGQGLTIISEADGWAYVQLPDGTKGYCGSFYLKR